MAIGQTTAAKDETFSERHAYLATDTSRTAILSSSYVPEMPDVRAFEKALQSVIKDITPNELQDKLNKLYQAAQVTNKSKPDDLEKALIEVSFTEEELRKIDELCKEKQVDKLKIFSQIHFSANNIFSQQLINLNLAHWRQVAKKGSNLKKEKVAATQMKKTATFKPFTAKLSFSIDEVDITDRDMRLRMDAAYRVINAWMNDKDIEAILEKALENHDPSLGSEISIVRPIKDYDKANTNYNILTNMYSQILVRNLNALAKKRGIEITFIDAPVMTLTATSRTDATAYERILKQPYFQVEELAGKNIIINDDHINAGGFTATLFAQSRHLGANILGVTALTTHPHTNSLAPDPRILVAIKQVTEAAEPGLNGYQVLNNALMLVGLRMDALTNREALTLLAIVMDGRNPEHVKQFEELDRSTRKAQVVEGIDDDLRDILKQEPKRASELAKQIKTDMSSAKYARYGK